MGYFFVKELAPVFKIQGYKSYKNLFATINSVKEVHLNAPWGLRSGPGGLKLMTLVTNKKLNFQTLYMYT